jgi:prepilin peptidase CpaA
MTVPIQSLLFFTWAAAVAVFDCRNRRIPNLLVVAGFAAAFASVLAHRSPFGISPLQAVAGAALGFVVLLPFFALRVMGAADVKVFSVLGTWCGASALLGLWIAASLAAAVHALVLLIGTRTPAWKLWRRGQPTFALGGRRATPYAALLVAAAALSLAGHVLTGVGQ